MSTARSLPRSRAWLRVLVLLLALTVPGTHTEMHVASAASMEIVEYDVLDMAVRPPAHAVRAIRRAVVPLRPVPLPAYGTPDTGRARVAPPRPPHPLHSLHALRSVVLRC